MVNEILNGSFFIEVEQGQAGLNQSNSGNLRNSVEYPYRVPLGIRGISSPAIRLLLRHL